MMASMLTSMGVVPCVEAAPETGPGSPHRWTHRWTHRSVCGPCVHYSGGAKRGACRPGLAPAASTPQSMLQSMRPRRHTTPPRSTPPRSRIRNGKAVPPCLFAAVRIRQRAYQISQRAEGSVSASGEWYTRGSGVVSAPLVHCESTDRQTTGTRHERQDAAAQRSSICTGMCSPNMRIQLYGYVYGSVRVCVSLTCVDNCTGMRIPNMRRQLYGYVFP